MQCRLEFERHPEVNYRRLGDVAHARTEAPVVEQIVEQEALAALCLDQVRLAERQLAAVAFDQRRKADYHFGVGLCRRPIGHHRFLAVRHELLVVVDVGDDIIHLLHRVAEWVRGSLVNVLRPDEYE